jgi:hypothetical protein
MIRLTAPKKATPTNQADVLSAEPLTKRELAEMAVEALADLAKCTRPFALSADKKRKFLSNRQAKDRFIAEIVFKADAAKNI